MSAPAYGIVGGLALDNVVTASGDVLLGRPGGNTLWASLGAALFTAPGEVGIVARAGDDYPQTALQVLQECSIRTDGVRRIAGPHRLRISYQHLPDGRRLQPVPQATLAGLAPAERAAFVDTTIAAEDRLEGDPQPADIPSGWRDGVRAWHLPLVPLATLRALVAALAPSRALLVADCPNRHEIRDFVADLVPIVTRVDVFSPSTSDLEIIDPAADPVQLCAELAERTGTPVVLKCGPDGVRVLQPDAEPVHVPSVATSVIDPTGAGDAFCGGFLVRYAETGSLLEAAQSGSRAAAYAVAAERVEQLAAVVTSERERL